MKGFPKFCIVNRRDNDDQGKGYPRATSAATTRPRDRNGSSPESGIAEYKGSDKLQSKPAIITGGDSGIGRAVAIAFAKEGADIDIVYFEEHEDAKETKAKIEECGRQCVLVKGDVGDEGFTRSLSLQLIERGIHVNAVAPGPIWTPLIPSTFPPDKVGKFGKDVPMKRLGQPDEVAPCYVFLASADSGLYGWADNASQRRHDSKWMTARYANGTQLNSPHDREYSPSTRSFQIT